MLDVVHPHIPAAPTAATYPSHLRLLHTRRTYGAGFNGLQDFFFVMHPHIPVAPTAATYMLPLQGFGHGYHFNTGTAKARIVYQFPSNINTPAHTIRAFGAEHVSIKT
jgi:hypothetical protein